MAQVFTVSQTIGNDVIAEYDVVISKWIDIDGLTGITHRNTTTLANPLHSDERYNLCRFQLTEAIQNAVSASAPDYIEIGGAGASSESTPKITRITHKASGFYYEIRQNPVTGSTENCRVQITTKWGSNNPSAGYSTTATYHPQTTTIRALAISHHYTVSDVDKEFLGFTWVFQGGSLSIDPQYHCAESAMYGNQANPLPPTTTQGGGGFGNYDKSTDVTVNIGIKPSGFLSGILGGSGFNFYFVPSYHDLIRAAYYSLNGVNNLSDFVNNTAALFLNPSNYIVSACAIPVDKSVFGAGAMQTSIRLGGLVNFNVDCYPLSSLWGDSDVFSFSFTGMYYDSFMDFEPYTKITLFLPYIGFVPLKPSECIGGNITVQYRFEGLTGKCIAFVKTTDRNGRNTGFYQYNGNAGYSLPWIGNNGGGSQMMHSAASAAVSVAKGDKTQGQEIAAFGASAAHFLAHDSRPTMQGGFGVNSGALGADDIVLFVQRAQSAFPANYYNIHGYQTATGGVVGDYSGYTVFDYVELDNCDATDAEKAEIEQLLKGGVYL